MTLTTDTVETAKSWTDLNEKLWGRSEHFPSCGRIYCPEVFRGVSSASYPLTNKLTRWSIDGPEMEDLLVHNFRTYSQKHPETHKSIWMWLSVAQHHRLPTRLMDWTYSPLVALHFATCEMDKLDLDGAVWCVDPRRCAARLPTELKRRLGTLGDISVFSVELLATMFSDIKDLIDQAGEEALLFFEPPSIDERIAAQCALFSVTANPRIAVDELLQREPSDCAWRKIIIPAQLKWDLRDRLDQVNINERVLFPGLDGLSDWLARKYLPIPELIERNRAATLERRMTSALGTCGTVVRGGGSGEQC